VNLTGVTGGKLVDPQGTVVIQDCSNHNCA
jgi:hypothetical protein